MSTIKDSLGNFQERRVMALSHDLRVYIFGVEVSNWLKGDLTITYGNRDSYNTASFDLANPRELWQLTRDNLRNKWNKHGASEYSELAKLAVFKYKNNKLINPFYELSVTTNILAIGDTKAPVSLAKIQEAGSEKPLSITDTQERRYRLAVNDCIFSRNDPLRIFMRNPYNSSSDEWVEVFCGFVQDHPVTTNYLNGESSIRISAYCIRQLLNNMRVQTNAYTAVLDNQPLFRNGKDFFSDFRKPTLTSQAFGQYSLEATIKELILGTSIASSNATGRDLKVSNGVGTFKLGNVMCYNHAQRDDTLERWHLITAFGVNKNTSPTINDDLWLSSGEVETLGRSTIYYPEDLTSASGPTGRYLHFLLPAAGTGATSLIQSTIDQNPDVAIEWSSRWEIIRDFASKLDFQVLTSPSGDLLVEFPMYGFTPDIFFSISESDRIQQDLDLVTTAVYGQNTYEQYSEVPPGLGSLFCFDLHVKDSSLNDEAEAFPTLLQVDGGISVTEANINGEGFTTLLRAYVFSPAHVARYGVVVGQLSIPFAGQKTTDASSFESVIKTRLPKLALIEYMKRLADASTMDCSVVYRPFLFPNRPVWIRKCARMGLLTSVSQRWQIGKSASTSISTHMLMHERINQDTGEISYRLPTGATNAPISYSSIWSGDEIGDKDSGVFTDSGTDSSEKSPSDGQAGTKGSGKVKPMDVAIDDPEYMYPPFSKNMILLVKMAEERGITVKIKPDNTYRTPEYQRQLYVDSFDKKTKKQLWRTAEPFKSYHQYGLAVDIDTTLLSAEQIVQVGVMAKSLNINWGGFWTPPADQPHFEWNVKLDFNSAEFKKLRDKMPKDPNAPIPKIDKAYLKSVWSMLDGRSPATAAKTTESKPKEPTTSMLGSLSAPKDQLKFDQESLPCAEVEMFAAGLKTAT